MNCRVKKVFVEDTHEKKKKKRVRVFRKCADFELDMVVVCVCVVRMNEK